MQTSNLFHLRWFTDLERHRVLRDGDEFPFWYGVVCYDPALRAYLIALIPLNFVISFVRDVWLRLKAGRRDQELAWAFDLGYLDGMANRERRKVVGHLTKMIEESKVVRH